MSIDCKISVPNDKVLNSKSTGWSHIVLTDNFSFRNTTINRFPQTFKILETIGFKRRLGPRIAGLAKQEFGKGISPHSDLVNTFLTLHLPIKVNGCAGIIINGTKHYYDIGKPIVMGEKKNRIHNIVDHC